MRFISTATLFMFAAVTTGGAATPTTTVVNSLVGEKELRCSFTIPSNGTDVDLTLKASADQDVAAVVAALINDTTKCVFTCAAFNNDFGSFLRYFKEVRTMVVGVKMNTDLTTNFDGIFTITEKDPSGYEVSVPVAIDDYKLPLGGGTYANKLEVPADKLRLGYWPGLRLMFGKMKKGSTLSFVFPVRGVNKPSELISLKQAMLG